MATKQFEDVDCQYGAPMGRAEWPTKPKERKSVCLFRVNLDCGGYDDGGAYFGLPQRNLWCATDNANYREFVRAPTRKQAAKQLKLSNELLKKAAC